MPTTYHTEFINGIPIGIPNKTISGNGFYISYNNYDVDIYGNDTTALVYDYQNGINGEDFFILNGDHRQEYINLIPKGFKACFEYFISQSENINKYSQTNHQYPNLVR